MKFKSFIQLFIVVLLVAFGCGIVSAQTYYLDQTLELSPNDGWEQYPFPGTMNYLTSTNPLINATNGSYTQNFWRFGNVKLPSGADGAVITGCSIEWYVPSTTYDSPDFTIYGVAQTDRDWIQSSTDYISEMTVTSASVAFSDDNIGTGWKSFSGLESVVQEIIDIQGWQYGWSSLVFLTKDLLNTDGFGVYSYDRSPVGTYGAKLHISWTGSAPPSDPEPTTDWAYTTYQISNITDDAVELDDNSIVVDNSGYSLNASGSNPHWTLLRWNNVALAQGTQIYDASLTVNLEYYYNPWFYIYGEDADNSQSLDDNYTISGRDVTSASAFYSYSGLSAGSYSFDHLKDVVQEIVDRPGWVENNAISLIIYENQDNKSANATAYDSSPSLAAKLNLAFEPTPTLTPTPAPLNHYLSYPIEGKTFYVPLRRIEQTDYQHNWIEYSKDESDNILYTPWEPCETPIPGRMVRYISGELHYQMTLDDLQ